MDAPATARKNPSFPWPRIAQATFAAATVGSLTFVWLPPLPALVIFGTIYVALVQQALP